VTEEQDRLPDAIRTLAGRQAALGPVPVAELLHRGRRARRGRTLLRAAIGTGALALAVTMAAAIAPASPADGPATLSPASSPASSPSAESHTGYRITLTYAVEEDGHRNRDSILKFEGATDPTTHRSRLTSDGGAIEWRIIGDNEYTHSGNRGWLAGNPPVGPRGTLPVSKLVAVEPQELLTELRALGSVTRTAGPGPGMGSGTGTGTGTGASETYTFSYVSKDSAYTGEKGSGGNTVTGSVELVQGRFRTVTIQTVLVGPEPETADPNPITRRLVVDFSDYGITVPVERPTVSSK